MTIILKQIWGNDPRSQMCRNYVFDYIQNDRRNYQRGNSKRRNYGGRP